MLEYIISKNNREMFRRFATLTILMFSIVIGCSKNQSVNTDEGCNQQCIDELDFEIPHIYITTEDSLEIDSKNVYRKALIRIDGKDGFESFEDTTGIRGRGNTTWNMPKKPYKLKLDSKAPLFGMAPYKKWILLAEYLDGSLLYNSVPFKMAQLLDMPFTNTIIPVELTINGEYQGFYVFTEHKEVGPNRIDLGDNGLLLEMDAYFDEELQFKSDKYDLPIMIKYPKAKNLTYVEGTSLLQSVEDDFNEFESLVYSDDFPNTNYLDYFDSRAYVNYMLVYLLTHNREINHPKSTYFHKVGDSKYRMGIIWDFDWGFGYSGGWAREHYDLSSADEPLFGITEKPGKLFFERFLSDPIIVEELKERWNWFKINKYDELINYVNNYSLLVEQAYYNDHEVWGERGSSDDPAQDLDNLLQWLDKRVQYLDSYLNGL